MRPPSDPVIRKNNPNKWYIEFHYPVPVELWPYHKRMRERVKVYDDINRHKGEAKERYAEERRMVWKHILTVEKYNPFEEELNELRRINDVRNKLTEEIEKQNHLTEEDRRKTLPLSEVFRLFLKSRRERTDNSNSISTYKSTVKWLTEYFEPAKLMDTPASQITRLQIAESIREAKKVRKWQPTTYNTQVDFCMTVFNWMAGEEYIPINPAAGKIQKLQTQKTKHQWYDRDTARIVKAELLKRGEVEVYRACAFTYHLCLRSQQELMKVKVRDIDWPLKRFRFRAEVSKNKREEYRDISPELMLILKEMQLQKLPSEWYIFGKFGKPGPFQIGKNYLAARFRPVRDDLELSDNFDIYGWKHTRVVHEMMKGADPYSIQHLCRHQDLKETQDYMRDFDISLRNIYSTDDLQF